MTKEQIFQDFIKENILVEKEYISKEIQNELSYNDSIDTSMVRIIKRSIDGIKNSEDKEKIARDLNKILN